MHVFFICLSKFVNLFGLSTEAFDDRPKSVIRVGLTDVPEGNYPTNNQMRMRGRVKCSLV